MFKYKLSGPPAALFNPSGLLGEAKKKKAKLAGALVLAASLESEQDIETNETENVLGGGSLLHRINSQEKEGPNLC